jgi:tetratricopeptide (TPR) repeat protein
MRAIVEKSVLLCVCVFVCSSCSIFHPRNYSLEAVSLLRSQNYTQLITESTDWLNKRESASVRFFRGCAYFSIGDYVKALSDFDSVLDIFHDDPFFFFNRGHALMMNGNYRDARGMYIRAITLFNGAESLDQYLNYSLILPIDNDCVPASFYASRTDFQGYLAYLYYVIGYSFEKEGLRDKYAMKHYTLAIDTDKSFWPAFYRRAELYLQHHAYQIALDDLNAMSEKLSDARIFFLKAEAFRGLKQYEAALANVTRAIDIEARAEFYFFRADMYDLLGKSGSSLQDRKRALKGA